MIVHIIVGLLSSYLAVVPYFLFSSFSSNTSISRYNNQEPK